MAVASFRLTRAVDARSARMAPALDLWFWRERGCRGGTRDARQGVERHRVAGATSSISYAPTSPTRLKDPRRTDCCTASDPAMRHTAAESKRRGGGKPELKCTTGSTRSTPRAPLPCASISSSGATSQVPGGRQLSHGENARRGFCEASKRPHQSGHSPTPRERCTSTDTFVEHRQVQKRMQPTELDGSATRAP